MSHNVAVKVTGANSSWTTFTTTGVIQNIQSALAAGQIGVNSVVLSNEGIFNPAYYEFIVNVNALDEHSDDVVKRLVFQALGGVLSGLTADVISSNVQAPPSNNNSTGATGIKAIDDILNNVNKASNSAATAAMFLPIGLAIAGIVILPVILKSIIPPAPSRR